MPSTMLVALYAVSFRSVRSEVTKENACAMAENCSHPRRPEWVDTFRNHYVPAAPTKPALDVGVLFVLFFCFWQDKCTLRLYSISCAFQSEVESPG